MYLLVPTLFFCVCVAFLSFGLFEAMSAIEMMDPKMDAGMIGNQVNRKVLNFEQAIKVSILPDIFNLLSFIESVVE